MNPWVIIGVIAALAASWYVGDDYGVRHTDQKWELQIAGQKNEAAQTKTELTDKVRAAESKAADLAAQLEEKRAKDEQTAASNDGHVRDLLAQLRLREREKARCGGGGGSALPGGQSPAGSADVVVGSDGGLSDPLDDDHRECAKAANVLAARVRECQAFAVSLPH